MNVLEELGLAKGQSALLDVVLHNMVRAAMTIAAKLWVTRRTVKERGKVVEPPVNDAKVLAALRLVVL